jgi:AcrR family transcriptional regulator
MDPNRTDEPKVKMKRLGGRSARIRNAVLEAALVLIGRDGVDEFSIAKLAKESGVNETTIYRRWGTIERLLLETLIERIDVEIPVPDTGSLKSDMTALLQSVIEFYSSPMGKILVRVLGAVATEAHELKQAFWSRRLKQIEPLISRAVYRGELYSNIDVNLFFQTLIGPVVTRLFITGETLTSMLAQEIVNSLISLQRKP